MLLPDVRAWALERPRVMGIINVTPDSFSDGGRFYAPHAALAAAQQMIDDGVDMLDLGAESTRPGAAPVSVQEEMDRILPVLEALRDAPVPLSLDSSSPEVMREALRAGVTLFNDVRALRRPGALELAASAQVAVCLMHMPAEPAQMQQVAQYDDVFASVESFLLARVQACLSASVAEHSIVLDPGFGFGKTFAHNRALFQALPRLAKHGFPLMVGVSRKRMIGELTGRDRPIERDAGSLAAHLLALERGANILRVHDVRSTVDAVKVWLGLV